MNEQLWNSHEIRIQALENQMVDLRITMTNIERDMTINNQMTAEIQKNTSELVILMKGTKILGKIIMWGGGITAAVLAAIEFIKYFYRAS